MDQKLLVPVVVALIIGGVIGYAINGWQAQKTQVENIATTSELTTTVIPPSVSIEEALKPNIYNPKKILAEGLKEKQGGFEFSLLAKTQTGSVELFRITDEVKPHQHNDENHFLYIISGKAQGVIGDVKATVEPGQLIQIPKGVPHSIKKIGKDPVIFILFSTPPFNPADIRWLEAATSTATTTKSKSETR